MQPTRYLMSQTAWRELLRVNRWVNEPSSPMTDHGSLGVIEKWSLRPTLRRLRTTLLLKRKMLIDAGWPREAR